MCGIYRFRRQESLDKVKELEAGVQEIHALTKDLALYFCEDESQIKLQDVLNLFKTFCEQLEKAKTVMRNLYTAECCSWVASSFGGD